MPVIPSQGSVGASGDLAPLAHMTAALIGDGGIHVAGDVMPAADALAKLGLAAFLLAPKEGLALINGTQASTALALDALFAGERVFAAAIAAGALSVEALKGGARPFDPRISGSRPARTNPRRRRDLRPARRKRNRRQPARCGRSRTPTASAASRR